nr:MAG TPA: hypothetical protein [Caudoviricetes sp.]
MAYFKNLIAETVLEVEDDQVDTYLECSDRYALCDINGNVIAEAEVAEAPEVEAPKAEKATKKTPAKEEKAPEAEVAEAPKAEAVVEER